MRLGREQLRQALAQRSGQALAVDGMAWHAPSEARGQDAEQPRELALVLGAVCLLCLTYLNLRTRAVEIVK